MFAAILIYALAQEIPTTWVQSKHGFKMMVTYQPNSNGANVLVVSEKDQITSAEIEKQRVDLQLKETELLSNHNGFDCVDATGDRVYAVVSSNTAKEKGSFKPARAWAIDQQQVALNPIKDLKTVSCEWSPKSTQEKFPYTKKK